MKTKVLVLLALLSVSSAFASKPDAMRKTAFAHKVNPHPPIIDGKLSDPSWQKPEWHGGFTQREPDDGAAPSQETAFKVLFDDTNLYIGVRAYDTEPDQIVKRVTRRDDFDGDLIEINIDSYFDHRTAFSFTINAAGVKGDETITNDGDDWDSNWNPVWFGAVAIDSLGWTAEIRIPFSQLRFSNKEQQVWGFQVMRHIFRKDERSNWQYIPQNSPGWVSYFGELRGIEGIRSSRRIELLPYGVTDIRREPGEKGNPFATGKETNFSGGLDAKYGVTSDLTLDLSVNPDFGQVEADPSEVNLTAFETFFPEKRPFFIEGQNILDFALMDGGGPFSNDRLFYSRRIGRTPQHSPDLDDDEYSLAPDLTSIVSAAKLTGKTKSGLSIGVLDAITAKETAQIDLQGERQQEAVEPLSNYFVARLQQDYNGGNTSIGGMFTATHRNLSQEHLKFLNRSAYSGGLDFRHQWQDKTYYLDVRTSFSHIRGDEEAITAAQEASQRYYQRPDADYVHLDTSRTSLSGHGGTVNIGRGGNGRLRASAGFTWRSPGLELNDLGFLRQADRVMQWTWLGYSINNPVSIFRKLRVNFNQWAGWNFGGESVFKGGNINGGGQFKNHWRFWLGVERELADLSTSELRGGPALKLPGAWNHWYNFSTDQRKFYQFGIGGFSSWKDDGGSRRHNVRFWLNLRPQDSLQFRINPFVTLNKNDLQYVDTVDNNGEDRYLFGYLDQKTFGITLRLDYSITPNFSIQYYGQPFLSSGEYTEFKRITDPRNSQYNKRFSIFSDQQITFDPEGEEYGFDENLDGVGDYAIETPDFSFWEFRSNLVVRWEYNPGSTIFFVWTQDRSGDNTNGNLSFRDGMDELFSEDTTNIFLVKVNRWFSL